MIDVSHISFSYDSGGESTPILSDVSTSIHPGEMVTIMGHNGSGKTTFARCLNGLLVPDAGNVMVDGLLTADPDQIAQVRRRVGMVFQNPDNQIVSATVEREIAFGLENLGLAYEKMHQIVDDILQKFDLQKYRFQPPHYLSGGEKQRLAIAAVMAMNPQYLVLDEPTSLLDPKNRRDILHTVRALQQETKEREQPITTILITQFPEEALFFDRLIVFHQGQIVQDDTPSTIFEREEELRNLRLEPPLSFKVDKLLNTLF